LEHEQEPPVGLHSCPSGQSPPQAGVEAPEQGTSIGAHPQPPAALVRQIWEAGQGPAQAGADAAPHVGTTGRQEHEVPPAVHA